MKIGISGSTCSGKTTFLNYLGYNMEGLRTKIRILNERALECPYPLNEKGGFITQHWILSNHILEEAKLQKKFPIIITDRTVLDSLAYLKYSPHNEKEYKFSQLMARNWNKLFSYDYVMYFAPLTEVIKPRRKPHQLQIDKDLRIILSEEVDHDKIIYIPVTDKDTRCIRAMRILKRLIGE